MVDLTLWWRRGSEESGSLQWERMRGPDQPFAPGGPERVMTLALYANGDNMITVGFGVLQDGPSAPLAAYWLSVRENVEGKISVRAWREIHRVTEQAAVPILDADAGWFDPKIPAVVEETP